METNLLQTPKTIMEVYKMLPEGTLAEVINGQLYMSPSPSNKHQWLLISMMRTIADFVDANSLGKILIAPSDVYLDQESNAVQPDIYIISHTNISQPLEEIPYHGVPDLIVEFLSPSNNRHDLVTKKELYEKFGVKEYWIIDPSTKESIVYKLENNLYTLAGKEIATVFSPLFNHSFSF
jgi:Uma2 family endonuclease